jgi:hypothetical protein
VSLSFCVSARVLSRVSRVVLRCSVCLLGACGGLRRLHAWLLAWFGGLLLLDT